MFRFYKKTKMDRQSILGIDNQQQLKNIFKKINKKKIKFNYKFFTNEKKIIDPRSSGIKILIIGVDGMLGHKLYEQLSKSFKEVYFTSKRLSRKKNKYFIKNINILNTKKY